MVIFELNGTAALTSREKILLAQAKKLPAAYDEDCPELADDMEKVFCRPGRQSAIAESRLPFLFHLQPLKK